MTPIPATATFSPNPRPSSLLSTIIPPLNQDPFRTSQRTTTMSINEPITQENVAQAPSTPPMDLPDISPAPAPASSPNKAITQIASEIENTSLVDHEADAEAEPAIVHKIKLCGVCDAKEARYKCVRCYLP